MEIFSYSITRCGMTSKGFLRVLSTALAVSIALPATVDTAEAQRRTLLEQIFPKAAERLRQQRQRRLGVSGPSNYTQPDKIVEELEKGDLDIDTGRVENILVRRDRVDAQQAALARNDVP